MEGEKVHLPMIEKRNAPGASFRLSGARVAIVLYYLNRDFG